MESLAVFGGQPVIKKPFNKYNSIGKEELEAAHEVIKSGNLSQFVGSKGEGFLGGPKVQEFEEICCTYFGTKYAVSVNSWTSGLIAAVGAVGIEPFEEIIVPTWTMCASATAILHWNAIPVFADIDPRTFNISPDSILKNISANTKAILAVDIFGQSCDIEVINKIAKDYSLKVITDTAQSPGAFNKNVKTGVSSDIGGFSFNYHKHVHTGEGGLLVTNNESYAHRMRLIRNHGEAVIESDDKEELKNIIGYNFRMGEIEAAIGIEQIKKLDSLVLSRQKAAHQLTDGLADLKGLILPYIQNTMSHSYYIYPIVLEIDKIELPRSIIVKALRAEGLSGLMEGYTNIHLLPIYQNKIAYGSSGFPWNFCENNNSISYQKGICPTAEHLHEETFLGFEMCLYELNQSDVQLIIDAFRKVWDNLDVLRFNDFN